jgi:hypothetical protein
MAIGSIGQRVLVKLINKLGVEQTSRELGIRPGMLMRFIEGKSPVPDSVLLKAIDYLLDEEVAPPAAVLPEVSKPNSC